MSQGSRQEVSRAVRARLEEGVSDCSRVKLECEEETLCQLIVYGSADSTGGDVTGLKRHQRQGRASLQRMLARLLPAASLGPVSEADADWGSWRSLCQEGTGHCTPFRPLIPCLACGLRNPGEFLPLSLSTSTTLPRAECVLFFAQ